MRDGFEILRYAQDDNSFFVILRSPESFRDDEESIFSWLGAGHD